MIGSSKQRLRSSEEHGFTLVELLVVIVILGILASVVVISVGGVGDKGQRSACTIDARALRTAEEAYFAKNGSYADMEELRTGGFLSEPSELHTVTPNNSASPRTFTMGLSSRGVQVGCPAPQA